MASVRLHGSRILVAGATGGIGSAICRALAAEGARLVVSGTDPARVRVLAADLGAQGAVADLTDPAAPEMLVGEAAERLAGLDAVICAIGVVAFGPVTELDDRVLQRLFAVNTLAPIRLTRAALAALPAGGAVVNISAIVADRPTAGMAAYSATKAALTGFDVAAAREARRAGVRVIDVRPPHMETGLAGRPIAGTAPRLAPGRDPAELAAAVVDALAGGGDTAAI